MSSPPQPLELKIEVAQQSDPGRDPNKQINEDSCGYSQTRFGHLVVLCDGMGGHYGGQEASRRAITTIFEEMEKAAATLSPAQALKHAVEVAGRRVYELGGPPENKVRPGSTVVAMILHDAGVDVAHVGDSRAYVIRSGQIYPLTRDHSMVQAMIDAGFLTEEQAIGHPDANKITRALGMKPEVDVELRPEPMELFPGDLLITSSDGLTDLALARDILGATRQALASGNVEHACKQLVRMANDRGGHDNITVQMVRVIATAQRRTNPGAAPQQQGHAMTTTVNEPPASMAMRGAGGQGAGGQGAGVHGGGVGPTAVDPAGSTVGGAPAVTVHDGTSQGAFAASPQGLGGTHIMAGGPRGAQPHAAMPGAGSQIQMQPQPATGQQGLYRMDGVGALPLPPMSVRYVPSPQFGATAGGTPKAPPPPGGGSSPPGGVVGAPQAAGPAAIPQAPASYAGDPALAPNSGDNRGGSVLFLALAISFAIAVVTLAIVWALFLR
ncbi:MAG: protein phosphatase 2C domain-containing protein [Polyangiaceae bacterium]